MRRNYLELPERWCSRCDVTPCYPLWRDVAAVLARSLAAAVPRHLAGLMAASPALARSVLPGMVRWLRPLCVGFSGSDRLSPIIHISKH